VLRLAGTQSNGVALRIIPDLAGVALAKVLVLETVGARAALALLDVELEVAVLLVRLKCVVRDGDRVPRILVLVAVAKRGLAILRLATDALAPLVPLTRHLAHAEGCRSSQ
jgi:hypothetical protein